MADAGSRRGEMDGRATFVFGPGDLRGQPYRLDQEKKMLLAKMYELYPEGHRQAGRRRFRRVGISLRKGSAKSELAAAIAAAELHAEAPVRFIEWKGGKPKGSGVTDPYIPLMAYTEEQSEERTERPERRLCHVRKSTELNRIANPASTGFRGCVESGSNPSASLRISFLQI
jgi:hypothetical protein